MDQLPPAPTHAAPAPPSTTSQTAPQGPRCLKVHMVVPPNYTKLWDDLGTCFKPYDGVFWKPVAPEGYFVLGDVIERGQHVHPRLTISLAVKDEHPHVFPALLASPVNWIKKWDNTKTGSTTGPCSIWEPVPPEGYVAMGCVVNQSIDQPPTERDDIKCVHKSVARPGKAQIETDGYYLWGTSRSTFKKLYITHQVISAWHIKPTTDDGLYCGCFMITKHQSAPPKNIDFWCLLDPESVSGAKQERIEGDGELTWSLARESSAEHDYIPLKRGKHERLLDLKAGEYYLSVELPNVSTPMRAVHFQLRVYSAGRNDKILEQNERLSLSMWRLKARFNVRPDQEPASFYICLQSTAMIGAIDTSAMLYWQPLTTASFNKIVSQSNIANPSPVIKGLIAFGNNMKEGVSNLTDSVTSAIQSGAASQKSYAFEDLTPTPFKLRTGCRSTLFQDAHCGDFRPKLYMTPEEEKAMGPYIPPNCFEQIYHSLLHAKRFIYITGWSVDTKISLLRKEPIFHEEISIDEGMMTIGQLLKYKASQGVCVKLHVWDEALSVDVGGIQTQGVMCTYDEETRAFFANTEVDCQLSYRTGYTSDNEFLWTHHQKTVICDASLTPYQKKVISTPTHISHHQCLDEGPVISSEEIEKTMSIPDAKGNRFCKVAFMTNEHNFQKIWDDTDTAAKPHRLAIFRPIPPEGWHIIGDYCERSHNPIPSPLAKIMIVKEPPTNDNQPPLLAEPVDFEQIWESTGTAASFGHTAWWKPIPPSGYKALGHIATIGLTKPDVSIMRCVHESALEAAHCTKEEDHKCIWTDKNSKAKFGNVSVWLVRPVTEGIVSGCWIGHQSYHRPLASRLRFYTLREPPIGVNVAPKPTTLQHTDSKTVHRVKRYVGDRRRIISYVGGLDLTFGRWDTPTHPLFRTLANEHSESSNDYLHGWALNRDYGPREPWHDIHGKFEGPIARDVMCNFEQRWRKQIGGSNTLFHLGSEFISIAEEELMEENMEEEWNCRLCRSIDKFSAEVGDKENGIQHAYVSAIRAANRFIYIENQYFLGSARHWRHEKTVPCYNIIPYEIATRIAKAINEGKTFMAYILLPMYPEGYPTDGAIQEILRWQNYTQMMMYKIVAEAIMDNGVKAHPSDYLNFFFVGTRETVEGAQNKLNNPPAALINEAILAKTRRFMIYVHSKLMIVDDEYAILGSANVNERSMAGDRDTEICVESWQPKWRNVPKARGGVHRFRMSLWAEHTGVSLPEFADPEKFECVHKIHEITKKNWEQYMAEEATDMASHLMPYPIKVSADGKVVPHQFFPDCQAPVKGTSALAMPDLLTT